MSSTCGDILVVQARGISWKVAFRERRRWPENMVVLIVYEQVDLTWYSKICGSEGAD